MQTITELLAQELNCRQEYIANVIALLDEGNTIPFIARYRKEQHGTMDDTTLRTLETRLQYLRNLAQRREEVKASIAAQEKLTDEDGQTYRYLYWEGVTGQVYDFSSGFCVAGSDTAAFLEDALEQLGLSRAEANEFIIYWLPRMQENAYNLIAFQHEAYTESARLTITPEPDTLIRVFMAYRPLEKAVEIAPQTLTAPERTGFTAVEWGGAECK